MDKANLYFQTQIIMKVIEKTKKQMAKVFINLIKKETIKVNGKTIKNMERD